MENDAGYYGLSSTAMELWRSNNSDGLNTMLVYLARVHKEGWFKRVIFKHSSIPEATLKEMAEDAFIHAWEAFNRNGKAGKIQLKEKEYTGYLFTIFKNTFLKSLARYQRQVLAEKEFGDTQALPDGEEMQMKDVDFFSVKTKWCLSKLTPEARQLLIWRHIEDVSYDEIAVRRNIARDSAIKMVSRYGREFLKYWKENNT